MLGLTLHVRRNESTQHGELEFMSNLTRPCATDSVVARSRGMKASVGASVSSFRAPVPPEEEDVVRENRRTNDRRMVSNFW